LTSEELGWSARRRIPTASKTPSAAVHP